MKSSRIGFFINTFFILLFLGFIYYYREHISRLLREIMNQLQPCERPITYSIVSFDQRFGLTEAELLNNIKQAEEVWESSIDKQLFEYSPTGDLKINFIYDYRQEAMDALEKTGIVINDDQATFDALKAKYDLLIASYDKEKIRFEELVTAYDADKSAYEEEVDYFNSRGGATKAEHSVLEQKRADLNNQVKIINQVGDYLNGMLDTINSAEIVLNKLIKTLNLKKNAYNAVGSSVNDWGEFSEGEYVSDASGTTINIFQFNDKNQLIEVLVHELGHSLGLEHIDNPKAVMYYLNESGNEELTADDISALKDICRIK